MTKGLSSSGTELLPPESGALENKIPAGSTTDLDRVLGMIERAGSDASADVGKMERLFALYKEMVQAKEMREFNDAMLSVQAECPPIVRDSLNPSTNSKYAKLEKIQDVLAPLLLKNRLAVSFGTDHSPLANHYGVTCLVSRGGYERHYRCDVPIDTVGMKGNRNKTDMHGFGSALSYGERYLLKLIFNIRLIGEDDDGNLGNKPKPAGPSVMQPPEPGLKDFARELWVTLKSVRGDKQNWDAANQWLWREEILDGAMPESAPNLSIERFKEVIKLAREKLAA